MGRYRAFDNLRGYAPKNEEKIRRKFEETKAFANDCDKDRCNNKSRSEDSVLHLILRIWGAFPTRGGYAEIARSRSCADLSEEKSSDKTDKEFDRHVRYDCGCVVMIRDTGSA